MNKLYIINDEYYDFQSEKVIIGGLFAYIDNLAILGLKLGFDVTVCQLNTFKKEFKYNNYNIIAFPISSYNVQKIYKEISINNNIIIISTDQINIKNLRSNTVTIQHGIAFDKPSEYENNYLLRNKYISIIFKILRNLKNVNRYNRADHLVCVDYNYYNWLKICGNIRDISKFHIITNFCDLSLEKSTILNKLQINNRTKKILFARRFVDYRGVLIFANAIKKLLHRYENLLVTFAGDGFYENYLKHEFKNYPNVNFIKFNQSDSLDIHFKYDIALIPSLYSEGTSLSLLEAMSAGCFPIVSIVGGLTNIIINDFNGILIKPTEDEIISSISSVLNMESSKFDEIVINAYNTARISFNKAQWEMKWTNLLSKIKI